MAIAARIPMMAMTINSSTKVKPFCFFFLDHLVSIPGYSFPLKNENVFRPKRDFEPSF
jgi:hypothetical protein